MKLLLDQGMPRSTVEILREAGFEAVHTGDIGLATADDAVILEMGKNQGCVIVTLDADFHTMLALSSDNSPSVIRIRIERLNGQKAGRLIINILDQYKEELEKGVVLTVQPDKIRFRFLPIQ